MLLLAFLFLSLSAQDAPRPGPIKAFGDWVVACDNAKACEMTSLYPGEGGIPEDGSGYEVFWLSIARDPGPGGGFTVEVALNRPIAYEVALRVDGDVVGGGTPRGDALVFADEAAERIVKAVAAGRELDMIDIGGSVEGRASLAGSSAALRFIDAEQGRAGGVTAAVAKGAKPASAVPAEPALPAIRTVRPAGAPAAITPALAVSMLAASGCDAEYAGDAPEVVTEALGGGRTLALLPCGAGAYNFLTVPFVIAGGKAEIARFDFAPGMTEAEDGKPMLVNAGWDAKTGRLSSYAKGRGLGDCGSAEEYAWDGARFRLVSATQMIECRGASNWLTVYRAEADPR